MSGGSQTTNSNQAGTSSSANSLPSWLTSAYQGSLGNATGLATSESANNPLAVGNQTAGLTSIAGVNPQSIGASDAALTNIVNGGTNGNATSAFNAANPLISSEASGSLMNPASNPYLTGEYNLAAGNVQNGLASEFGTAGSNVINSVPVQQQSLSDLATQLYGGQYDTDLNATQNAQSLVSGNYNTGVGAINTAAATSPSVTTGLYTPGNNLLNSGTTANNNASWYSQLLGQTALPFGISNSSSTGSGSSTTQNNPSALSTIGSVLSLI